MTNTITTKNYDGIFEDDKLNIKSNVINFAHLIEQDTYRVGSASKVYSISAEFGIGKTFFCNKLEQVLAEDKVKVGKLNIWEMDFYENPLIPILAELNKLYSNEGKSLPSKIVSSLGHLSSKTLSALCEISAKVASNIAIGVDVVDVCKDNFSSETIYDDYKEYQSALSDLKSVLTGWASIQDKPIVIIIDELDRCRPDYAVKTLEVLKHIFDIPGFVFILALDEEQLKNSVQTLFGTMNYEGYKRKFINNSFILPQPNRLSFTEYLYEKSGIDKHIEQIKKDKKELVFKVNIGNVYLCARYYSDYGNINHQEIAQKFNQTQTSESIIKRYFAAYSECFSLSLRQMEQVFDRLVLFTKQINASKELFSPDLATFLICIHEYDIELFKKIRKIKNLSYPILSAIFANSAGSMVYKMYNELAFEKFKPFDRKIIPEVIPIISYSYRAQYGEPQKIISDNIDRFYIDEPETWLHQRDALSTQDTLTYDTEFDKEQFKENYCKYIDFIGNFE